MKHYYFLVSLFMVIMSINANFYGNFIIIFVCLIYYYFYFHNQWWMILILLIIFNFHFLSPETNKPTSEVVKVIDIKQNYIIADTDNEQVYLYNVFNVGYDDVLEIEGNYEEVYSLQNFHLYNFMDYSHKKGIHYQMFVNDYTILSKNRSIKNLLFEYVQSIDKSELRSYLLQIFYQIKDDNYIELLFLSGFHLRFLVKVINKLIKVNESLLLSIITLGYTFLFPMRFFVRYLFFRSSIDFLMKHINTKNRFGVTIICLLLMNPFVVTEFSFMAIFIFNTIQLFKVKRISKLLLPSSIMLPLQLYHFHEVNIMMLLCYPILQRVHLLLLACAIVSVIFHPLSSIFVYLISMYEWLILIFHDLYTFIGKPKNVWMLLWFLVLLKTTVELKRKYILYFVLLLLYQQNMASLQLFGEVLFIDVGQGDCILIREPMFGKTIMIDVAGSFRYELADDVIYPVLKVRGIKKIDVLIVTHDDYDHNGSLDNLKELITIDEVYTEIDKLELNSIELYNLNDEVKFEDKNENSIVLYGTIYGFHYLFTGDAGIPFEQAIMEEYQHLPVDILKVSHHGSISATTNNFLHFIDPLVGVISSGRNNSYGHPDEQVVDNLHKQGTTVLDTQQNGSVQIYYFRNLLFMRTMSNEFGIMIKVKL